MNESFVINPRIKVINCKQFEVSFNEEETIENKEYLKKNSHIQIVDLAGYNNLEELLIVIKKQISNLKITESQLHESAMLKKLKTIPILATIFSLPQPIWENYTLEEHIIGVKNTIGVLAPNKSNPKLWTMATILHDIGKAVAVYFENNITKGQKKQKSYNLTIAKVILATLNFNHVDSLYILTLIDKSYLPYQYVIGDIDYNNLQNELKTLTARLNEAGHQTSALELLTDLKTFWIADGSDYGVIKCLLKGLPLKPSFCHQFIFVFELKNHQWQFCDVRLKSSWRVKYEELVQKLQQE